MNGQADRPAGPRPGPYEPDPQDAVAALRADFGGPEVLIFFGQATGDFTALVSIGAARLVLADPDPSELAGSLRLLQGPASKHTGSPAPVRADGTWRPVPDSSGRCAGAGGQTAGDGPAWESRAVPGP